MMTLEYQLTEIEQIAQTILNNSQHKVILFNGEIGAGKTTIIKCIAKKIGVIDNVGSPTYSIVNQYHTQDNALVYHFDFYRLNGEEEAYDIGIDDNLNSGNLCLVEWAEIAPKIIPPQHTVVNIEKINPDTRRISIENIG